MSPQTLGRTLIIANPAAYSGKGENAVLFATRYFSSFYSTASSCEVRLIEGPDDAQRMASDTHGYQSVIALGGDRTIHEIVNGLMRLDEQNRPRLGIIPMGSSNDFARTLGMPRNDPANAISELLHGEERRIDLGRVNDVYFVQTLSFGIDAAIAIDSTDRASKNKQAGSHLFVTSGIKIIVSGLRGWPYQAVVDGEIIEGMDFAFAVQNGPTYGGGFRICPDAVPNDGQLDLCLTVDDLSVPQSLKLFGLIRTGKHTKSSSIAMRRMRELTVRFQSDDVPPCQADGEKLVAREYHICVVPLALRVVTPANCPW
ncbi:MAG: diacylglycerol kinase family lipid kinase [Coriobacteriales bacterium]|nr:diacylglycerol kinase family lipid kinase [Coriobacteriales bacterium]